MDSAAQVTNSVKLTTGEWYGKKMPAYRMGFGYNAGKFPRGKHTPGDFDSGNQRCDILARHTRIYALDLDLYDDAKFDGYQASALARYVAEHKALPYVKRGEDGSLRFLVSVVEGDEWWPAAGRCPWGEIRSAGIAPSPGTRHPNGVDVYELVAGPDRLVRPDGEVLLSNLLEQTPELIVALEADGAHETGERRGVASDTELEDHPWADDYVCQLAGKWWDSHKAELDLPAASGASSERVWKAVVTLKRYAASGHFVAPLVDEVRAELPDDSLWDGMWLRAEADAEPEVSDCECLWDRLRDDNPEMFTDDDEPYASDYERRLSRREIKATGAVTSAGDLWDAHEALGHIRQAAYARTVSPFSVLLCVLARVSALRPWALNGYSFDDLSLNYAVGILGESSAGKSMAMKCAEELLPARGWNVIADADGNTRFKMAGIGTGEGIIDLYRGLVSVRATVPAGETDKGGRPRKVPEQVRHNAMLSADEGSTFVENGNKQSATLLPIFNSAWTGRPLSTANALANFREVSDYAFACVVGFQPALLPDLAATGELGTVQRFVFGTPYDTSLPRKRPAFPGPLAEVQYPNVTMREPSWNDDGRPRAEEGMQFAQAILEEVDERRHAVATRQVRPDAKNGKRDEIRLRTAALLHLLCGFDGRTVGAWCWQTAGVIVDQSEAVRDATLAEHYRDREDRQRTAEQIERDALVAKMADFLRSNPGRTSAWGKVTSGPKQREQFSSQREEMEAEALMLAGR